METIAPGPVLIGHYVLLLAVRQLLVYLAWVLVAALAGAAACWCCGYGAQAAWARAEETRRAWRGPEQAQAGSAEADEDPPEPAVAVEVERGLREIEDYLAGRSVILPRPEHLDQDEAP